MDFYFGLFTTFIVIIPCCGFKTGKNSVLLLDI